MGLSSEANYYKNNFNVNLNPPKLFYQIQIKTIQTNNTAQLSLYNGMGAESVSVSEAFSHADTLEISCHSRIRVLHAAGSGIHGKQKTYKLSKQFNERLNTKSLKYGT